MTKNAALKRAIRQRMAATGEKYTEARRAVRRSAAPLDDTAETIEGNAAAPPSLFSSRPRVALWELPATTSAYERLDRSDARSDAVVRSTLDDWFARLPAPAQQEIAQRFASRDLSQHLGAFWELYLHRLVTGLGFDVDLDIGRDSAHRRPDFLLSQGDSSFYIEATVALGDDAVPRGARARADQFYDAAERIRNRAFLLHTNLRHVGPNSPSRKLVTDQIEAWLDTLDPDALIAAAAADQAPPRLRIDQAGWLIDIEASGIKPDIRNRPELKLGVIGTRVEGFDEAEHPETGRRRPHMRALDDVTPLARKLRRKASHYDNIDRPYVVAVLCAGTFVADRDIYQALVGQLEYVLPRDGGDTEAMLDGDGLWRSRGGDPQRRDVSAVLTVSNLTPAASAAIEPTLWIGPAPRRPLDPSLLPFTTIAIDTDFNVTETPARGPVAPLLGLADRWPAAD